MEGQEETRKAFDFMLSYLGELLQVFFLFILSTFFFKLCSFHIMLLIIDHIQVSNRTQKLKGMGHGKFNLVFNTLTLPLCGLENLLEVPKLLLIEEEKKPQGNPGR